MKDDKTPVLGSIQDNASKRVENLKSTWKSRPESEGKRLVSKILLKYTANDPLIKAILNNDSHRFDEVIKEEKNYLVQNFEIACLCRSEELIEHLINKYNFIITESENAIGYALSTGDEDFAIKIARKAKQMGQVSPGNIHLYNACNASFLREIESLFPGVGESNTKQF